jgi:Ca2+-binding RTX toxin-like protein
LKFRKKSLRAATVAVGGVAVAGAAWIALPADAATTGTVSVVESNVVTYTAATGKANTVVLTQSGNTVTVDDTTAIKAGTGCVAVSGDATKIRCTPTVTVNWVRVDLGDLNDIVVNQANLGMTARTGAGNDRITGGPKRDDIYAGDGDDVLQTNGGNDVLRGDAGNDLVIGGEGADSLSGSTGNDTLNGGPGDDTASYAGAGDDIVYGGDGNDGPFYGGPGLDKLYGGIGVDTLYGDEDNDLVDGGAENSTLYGGAGDDRIVGGNGDSDYLSGDAGNDRIEGGPGVNHMFGAAGNDELVGGPDTDHMEGSLGNDIENGGDGLDYFHEDLDWEPGTDADTFIGGGDDDVVVYSQRENAVTADNDGVEGDDGAAGEGDTIDTSVSIIWGGRGDDHLTGASGDDSLRGGPGNDTLVTGDGDDALFGDTGTDTLDAGAGFDYCADPVEAGESAVNCEYGDGAPPTPGARSARNAGTEQDEKMKRLIRLEAGALKGPKG